MNAALFKKDMEEAIRLSIAHLDRGTVGISQDCLWGMVAQRVSHSPHGPAGTNAGWVAKQTYLEIVSRQPYAGFVYPNHRH